MLLDIKILNVYNNINYYNKLVDLCKSYKNENHLEKTNKNEVLIIFNDLGYPNTKYKTNENFYQIKERIDNLEFYYHVSLKYGVFELIFGVFQIYPKEHLAGGLVEECLSRLNQIIKI